MNEVQYIFWKWQDHEMAAVYEETIYLESPYKENLCHLSIQKNLRIFDTSNFMAWK